MVVVEKMKLGRSTPMDVKKPIFIFGVSRKEVINSKVDVWRGFEEDLVIS